MPDKPEVGGEQVASLEPEVTAEILDRLEAMPADDRREVMAILYQHKGPLPDPASFAAYGQIYPEAPREILAMARRDHEHRIDMASRSLTSEISYRRETLWAATIVFLTIIGSATAVGMSGHEVAAGAIIGTGGVIAGVGTLLKGRDLFPKGSAPAKAPEPVPQPEPAPTPPAVQARSRAGRPLGRPRRG